MQTSKRILCSFLGLLLIMAIIFGVLCYPSLCTERDYFQDAKCRESLKGTIDCIAIGSSHMLAAFDPRVFDERMDTNSYNLSSAMLPFSARKILLEKELSRNPVDTVIFEVSYNALTRNSADEYGEGEAIVLQKLGFYERFEYFFTEIPVNQWLNVSYRLMSGSINEWKQIFKGWTTHVDYSKKGYRDLTAQSQVLSADKVNSLKDCGKLSVDMNDGDLQTFDEILKLCKEHATEVIIVVVPVSDATIWQYDNWDEWYDWLKEYSGQNQCRLFDFNLLHSRYQLWNDEESFYDQTHLAGNSAILFTQELATVLSSDEGQNSAQSLFYNNYEEMKKDSPYHKMIEE